MTKITNETTRRNRTRQVKRQRNIEREKYIKSKRVEGWEWLALFSGLCLFCLAVSRELISKWREN
jgi:hypothetical protein